MFKNVHLNWTAISKQKNIDALEGRENKTLTTLYKKEAALSPFIETIVSTSLETSSHNAK